MNRTFKNINDLLADEYFIEWVYDPSEKSNAFWSDISKTSIEHKELIEQAKILLLGLSIEEIQVPSQISSEIRAAIPTPEKDSKQSTIPLHFLKMAAAALLIIAAVGYFFTPQSSYSTDFGKTQQFSLKDGTHVILNANSSLDLSNSGKANLEREVWLDGEAFFDVKSDAQHPFIVHTSYGDIVVSGTRFNVEDTQEQFSVYLEEGEIKFVPNEEYQAETIDIDVKKHLIFNESSNEFELETSNDPNITAWKDLKIVCQEMSLNELSSEIESFYGVNVLIKDNSLADRKFTGTLVNQSLEELLYIVSEAFDLNVKSNKSSIELSYD